MTQKRFVIIGGGAAGFFAAIRLADACPQAKVLILEAGKDVLQKVRISGGGRCNVTHDCYEPKALAAHYPRGERLLKGAFHHFSPEDMVDWLKRRGVMTKVESDGRIFPVSNDSMSIIRCFKKEVERLGIQVRTSAKVVDIEPKEEGYAITLRGGEVKEAEALLIATGSNAKMWQLLANKGYKMVEAVPSLFTFNIKDERIKGLAGVVQEPARVQVIGHKKLQAEGPLLVTHWGMSGPAILRLSAWGARSLAALSYDFKIIIQWLTKETLETVHQQLLGLQKEQAKRFIIKRCPFEMPLRLWQSLVKYAGIEETTSWADLTKKQRTRLANELIQGEWTVSGKSTFKEEFVTAGGVALKEIHTKSFESKRHTNLFFAGEVLDIDAITGGFNFQAAWTGAWIAASTLAERWKEEVYS